MSKNGLLSDNKQLYKLIFVVSNAFLVFSIIIFSIYLVAPLLGGKLSFKALTHYGTWILLALGAIIFSQRARRGLRIRLYEYMICCCAVIINVVIWFSYPINIILGILCIIGMVISYRAQNNKNNE